RASGSRRRWLAAGRHTGGSTKRLSPETLKRLTRAPAPMSRTLPAGSATCWHKYALCISFSCHRGRQLVPGSLGLTELCVKLAKRGPHLIHLAFYPRGVAALERASQPDSS